MAEIQVLYMYIESIEAERECRGDIELNVYCITYSKIICKCKISYDRSF